MFVGDFNAHHILWGCDSSDRIGKLLARAAEACDICTTNDDLPTLLLPPNAHISIIDLVAVSSSLAPLTVTHTAEDTHGNDHFPIFTRIGGEIQVAHKFLYKLKLRPSEVKKLREILASPPPSFFDNLPAEPTEIYEYLMQHLVTNTRSFSPLERELHAR